MSAKRVISVFGGSAPRPGEPAYREAESLGRALAQAGFEVATGGYVGTMEAVSKGAAEVGGGVIGVTCEQIERWRDVRPNRWVTEEVRCETLRERAYRLIAIGEGAIALPGGVGTLSEVALAWSLLQTQEIEPRPIVLVGDVWRRTLTGFLSSADGYLGPSEAKLLTFVPDAAAAVRELVSRLKGQETRNHEDQ
jgi:uncharacterized protein (TIGR00730 family)